MKHNFHDSLRESKAYTAASWWEIVYRRAFFEFSSMVSVDEDGWAQRAGIDRVITLRSGRTYTVDEKVRKKDYGDILLERWSSEHNRKPGWVQKQLGCDYIAYAIIPKKECFLFPVHLLQRAWKTNGRDWIKIYKEIRADNGTYTTVSTAVPTDVLLRSIKEAMNINWK